MSKPHSRPDAAPDSSPASNDAAISKGTPVSGGAAANADPAGTTSAAAKKDAASSKSAETTARTARKGPRRASVPAGAPVRSASQVPALLIVDSTGHLLQDVEKHDPATTPPQEHRNPPEETSGKADSTSTDEKIRIEAVVHAETADQEPPVTAAGAGQENSHVEEPAPGPSATVELSSTAPGGTNTPPTTSSASSPATTPSTSSPATTPTASTASKSASLASPQVDAPADTPPATLAVPQAEPGSETATNGASKSIDVAVPTENINTPSDAEATAVSADSTTNPSSDSSMVAGEIVPEAAASEASAASASSATAAGSAALSRRERRLAEQKAASDVEPGLPELTKPHATPATALASESAGVTISKTASEQSGRQIGDAADTAPEALLLAARSGPGTQRKHSRPVSFLKGLLILVVIAVIVLAMGTIILDQNDSTKTASATEVNRQTAWENTTALLAQATILSQSATTASLKTALQTTVQDLTQQTAALGDGLPEETPHTTNPVTVAPSETVAGSKSPEAAGTAAPATVSTLLQGLHDNGQLLLGHAETADQAMGRVFASVGTSQLLRAQLLAETTGKTPLESDYLPARINFSAPDAPTCSSTLDLRPGVTIDAALNAAAVSEQKAVYAYQVAATQLATPQSSEAQELLTRHERKLAVLNGELEVRCLAPVTTVPGYALDPTFSEDPTAALATLEKELGTIYADLAALSTPTTTNSAAATAPAAVQQAGAETTSVGYLRDISVAWLLDSSASSIQWGGTVAALAGIEP